MADELTAKIGKDKEGDLEFGEVYHAVVGKHLNADFYPKFVEFDAGEKFFELFAQLEDRTDAKPIPLTKTAKWIVDRYKREHGEALWKKIAALAEAEKWSENLPKSVQDLLTDEQKVLIWLRSKNYKQHRKITLTAAEQLANLCRKHGALPVFVGRKLEGMSDESTGLWEFFKDPFFGESGIAKQLWCLNLLYDNGGVLASVGMMSGAMDGLAMICGKKVVFLAKKEDASPRMIKVSMAVPALHWVELFYSGNFQQLSDVELEEIGRRIWA
jgi:hypothetical protein